MLTRVLATGLVLILTSCASNEHRIVAHWTKSFADIGSSSSPRTADLNRDGVQDIVFGVGKLEFETADTAVIALDGADGTLLWHASASDQIFGSPRFMDINSDDIPEVFIGGRSGELLALDGKMGLPIWRFREVPANQELIGDKLFNFYNLQFVRDFTNDGCRDILIAYGGDVTAQPDDPFRPAGKLMLIDGKLGSIINMAEMPDGRETYMSPVILNRGDKTYIIFGSGGETMPGKVFMASLQSLRDGDLTGAMILAESEVKGFIAPPVLTDITQDGNLDIIVNAVEGRTIAIDGLSLSEIWSITMAGTEVYGTLAVGHYNSDDVQDFFVNYGIGQFPHLKQSVQVAINGKNGFVISRDTVGHYHYGSSVAYDLNGDGLDEVWYHANFEWQGMIRNVLKVFDFSNFQISDFSLPSYGATNGSTPFIEDLDEDGYLEIIFLHENDPFNLFSKQSKKGVTIRVASTSIEVDQPIRWGGYMGSTGDAVWR